MVMKQGSLLRDCDRNRGQTEAAAEFPDRTVREPFRPQAGGRRSAVGNSAVVLKNMTYEELTDYVLAMGEKKFRAAQIFKRLYQGSVSFDEFTELPAALRQRLSESAVIDAVSMIDRQISRDGTRKYLFEVPGGDTVESVYMEYKYGSSICISSQAGCRMGCAFCASGIRGLTRNLTAGEIVDQIVSVSRDTGIRIGHVVVMGTGEPFDNYEELIRALRIIHDGKGLGIGSRNVTVSTCGLTDRIYDFARDMPQVGLAVSLHAADDEVRKKLMPIARSCSMDKLMKVCRDYTEMTHRRITFEYALIRGVNDTAADAEKLSGRLKGMLCHVNLIPLNTVDENQFHSSAAEQSGAFARILSDRGIQVTVRRQLGADISAACGQLRLNRNRG